MEERLEKARREVRRSRRAKAETDEQISKLVTEKSQLAAGEKGESRPTFAQMLTDFFHPSDLARAEREKAATSAMLVASKLDHSRADRQLVHEQQVAAIARESFAQTVLAKEQQLNEKITQLSRVQSKAREQKDKLEKEIDVLRREKEIIGRTAASSQQLSGALKETLQQLTEVAARAKEQEALAARCQEREMLIAKS